MNFYAEMISGTARKFYQVEICPTNQVGFEVVTTYGRIGARGQVTSKSFIGKYSAENYARDLFSSKLKKGYVEKTPLAALGSVLEENDGSADAPPFVVAGIREQLSDAQRAPYDLAMGKLGKIAADSTTASSALDKSLGKQATAVLLSLGRAWGKLQVGRVEPQTWQRLRSSVYSAFAVSSLPYSVEECAL